MGPIRLNLSKSGLGLSAGVTGARVGIGPNGAYVHGGRHGLYYRKYQSSGKTASSQGQSDTHAYFVDTGLTYGKGVPAIEKEVPGGPVLKQSKVIPSFFILLGILLIFPGAIIWSSWVAIPALLLIITGVAFLINGRKQMTKARALLENVKSDFENKEPLDEIVLKIKAANLPGPYKQWLDFHFFMLVQDTFYEDPDYISFEELLIAEKQLDLTENDIVAIKKGAFQTFLEEVMEDHLVSEEEEKELEKMQATLQLDDKHIQRELKVIKAMVKMRKAIEEALTAVEHDLNLDEQVYYKASGRLLKEKIMQRYQRNNIQYKEIGYDVDMEGEILLTGDRILIVAEGSRSYDLDRILNITLSLEDNTVQLALEDRKNPLIFSMENVPVFAGKLEKLTEA